ncbi:MAG: DUF1287 domain-containing protein [Hyphomicrobiaceae bacterium]|nr:DUF1287 domain-containing protein [Hyphomicrobiaceae bacterium]
MLLLLADFFGLKAAPLVADTKTVSMTQAQKLAQQLTTAALARLQSIVTYDPAYVAIAYPMGDVPADTGVCSDVIIRSYRALGIDLQKRVHEDMVRAFSKYPKRWGLKRTDKNIDHRRVPNLRRFFTRHGMKLAISTNPDEYKPGDLVTWDLARRTEDKGSLTATTLPHIGIVTDRLTLDAERPLIVHNAGRGPQLEDLLFDYKITGHYRYLPEAAR